MLTLPAGAALPAASALPVRTPMARALARARVKMRRRVLMGLLLVLVRGSAAGPRSPAGHARWVSRVSSGTRSRLRRSGGGAASPQNRRPRRPVTHDTRDRGKPGARSGHCQQPHHSQGLAKWVQGRTGCACGAGRQASLTGRPGRGAKPPQLTALRGDKRA